MKRLLLWGEITLGAGVFFALVFLAKVWVNGFALALPLNP